MKRINTAFAALALFAALSGATFAQQAAPTASAASTMAMTVGVVKKVDTEQGKVTIQHEAITNLDMPPMTMVFRADKATLGSVKAGDKVLFHAESAGGGIAVTHLQPQN